MEEILHCLGCVLIGYRYPLRASSGHRERCWLLGLRAWLLGPRFSSQVSPHKVWDSQEIGSSKKEQLQKVHILCSQSRV